VPCRCCREAYEDIFDEKLAEKDVRRYRRRGLDAAGRTLVGFLKARGVEGQRVLEIGGGVGALQLELLGAGAADAENVELSHGYEKAARELARERGVENRVSRRVGDFVATAKEVAPADVVLLHRVVCCYPNLDELLGAAAERTERRLVLTYPPHNAVSRVVISLLNFAQRLRRHEFRVFVWPRREINRVAESRGLVRVHEARASLVWRWAAFERPA
jgi:magnesium-protoporphyrin O-methyltransferase